MMHPPVHALRVKYKVKSAETFIVSGQWLPAACCLLDASGRSVTVMNYRDWSCLVNLWLCSKATGAQSRSRAV